LSSRLHQLKDRLPHTWDAFFGRFGRFTEIQAQAIEPLLEGKNCVLASATASGKTEAALAPLLERHQHAPQRGLSLLYLVPTRALARDLARRLEQPMAQLAMRLQVKTGDEPALNAARPPELLLTTPESFDSLLAHRARLAKDVRAVVLDEIHLYDNTARGDQLRILLNRLRRIKRYALARGDITSDRLQFCALSATINDPLSVASRYFADPVVVQSAGPRELEAELRALDGPERFGPLLVELQRRGRKKLLVFCNRRAECEEWAHLFRRGSPFGDRVFVHHGSLDARVRRAAERDFAMAEAALCFATSTLELGIDIGDVDLIVLIGPPESTSAFLQRIGRGNRRTARASVVCFYRTATEQALFRVFIRAARAGELESSDYFFRPSVVVQQLCSYIKQTRLGELDPESAYELFTSPPGEPLLPKSQYESILEHLTLKQYFTPVRGRLLKPGPKWQELYEQRAIYTNLMDAKRGAIAVVDELTGRRLGEIEWRTATGLGTFSPKELATFSPRGGPAFLFGGRAQRPVRVAGGKLMVRPSDEEAGASAPRFRTPWRPLTPKLAQAIAAELGVPRAGSAAEIAMMVDQSEPQSEDPDEDSLRPQAWVFHCAGDAYGLVLGDLLETLYRVKVEDSNGLYLLLTGRLPAGPLQFSAAQVRAQLRRRWQQFESWFELGRFQSHLPLEVRRASAVAAFNVEEFVRTFSGRRITEIITPATSDE
jgi:ATP-dependent Lhr-like helicase